MLGFELVHIILPVPVDQALGDPEFRVACFADTHHGLRVGAVQNVRYLFVIDIVIMGDIELRDVAHQLNTLLQVGQGFGQGQRWYDVSLLAEDGDKALDPVVGIFGGGQELKDGGVVRVCKYLGHDLRHVLRYQLLTIVADHLLHEVIRLHYLPHLLLIPANYHD